MPPALYSRSPSGGQEETAKHQPNHHDDNNNNTWKTTDGADGLGNRDSLLLAIALLQILTPVRADEGRHRRLYVYDQHRRRRLAGAWPTLPVWCEWLPSLSTTTTMTTTNITITQHRCHEAAASPALNLSARMSTRYLVQRM
ncbi:hypothetical protein CPLU01_12343 [Colletotrichum plurivorum]|uniref:Uncharacterized protein n=1 Tax=Colletotrichum plurivorum TaxID=2175906 RepID=A0A8H6JZZ3_9PEZI|nr:hypothetical protein CPLU01_12343 [Colletotrichum plurivorum]